MGAGLAEVSELKAIEMEVRKSVDNDVKKVTVFIFTYIPGTYLCSMSFYDQSKYSFTVASVIGV